MTFTAAVAAGPLSVAALQHRIEALTHEVGTASLRDEITVAWSTTSRWISVHDDDSILVVVDGHLHEPFDPDLRPAALLHQRYRERGRHYAEGLLGDFVAIVLDRARRTLLVSRDPVGVRPWYQAASGSRHSGATDVATLCTLPWVDDTVDERMAIAFLTGTSESRGQTLHKGITTLGPGTTWRWTAGSVSHWKHHHWRAEPQVDLNWHEAAELCRDVLDQAVGCRLRTTAAPSSDVSGGLDSSSVVGTAILLGCTDLMVGRLLFDGAGADEREYSDAVIDHWGLPSVSAPPWLPSEDESSALTADLRRPPPDPNFTMFMGMHRAFTAEGRHDGLTGLGGDDAFVAMRVEQRVVSAVQLRQHDVLADILRAARRSPKQQWTSVLRPTLRHVLRPGRRRRKPHGWLSPSAPHRDWLVDRLNRPPDRLTGVQAIDLRYHGITSGYHASILEDAAVIADLAGRRSSHPLLDPRLVQAVYGLHPWFPVHDGRYRALQVAAYSDRLPHLVLERTSKAEFSEVVWARALDDALLQRVWKGPLGSLGWLDEEGFGYLVRDARQGRTYASLPLSRILAFDRWLEQGATL